MYSHVIGSNFTIYLNFIFLKKYLLFFGWEKITDYLDNKYLNKYEKNLKNRKKNLWICSSTYRLMVIQRPSNYNRRKLYKILMVLDGVPNDNEIAWNLNHHQSISRRTYPYDFLYF
jgi:hypothetical protein